MRDDTTRDVLSDNGRHALLPLLTIFHDELPEPLRFVRDTVDLVSRGETYIAFPFDFSRPNSGEQGQEPARLVIDNLDRRIVDTIRVLSSPPQILLETVSSADPDYVEDILPIFTLGEVSADRTQVEGVMIDRDEYTEPLMRWSYDPATAPALFQ